MGKITLGEIKEQLNFARDIVLRTRTDLTDYQKDMCVIAFIVGNLEGKIDLCLKEQESVKKEG